MPARLLAILMLVGCLGCPPPRLTFGPEGPITDAEQLLSLTRAAERQVVALQGEGKLRVEGPQGKGVVTLFVAANRPALLHLEQLDFFGKPEAVLTANADRFGLYQASDGKYYQGPATAQNLSRFLPIALPPKELVELLLGQVPRIPHEEAAVSVDEEARAYKLLLRAGEVVQTLWVHPEHFRVLRSQVRGASAYDLELGGFGKQAGLHFPEELSLHAPASDVRLQLRYQEVALNPALDLTLYELSPPPGVPVVEVDAQGNVAGEGAGAS